MSTSKLATGDYEVVDVRCRGCRAALGWHYLAAMQEARVAAGHVSQCAHCCLRLEGWGSADAGLKQCFLAGES